MSDRESASQGEKFWIELREPWCVPELKGAFPTSAFVKTVKEFMVARPGAHMTIITIHDGHPSIQDGPEALEMADGRCRRLARRHRISTDDAFAESASPTPKEP